MFRTFIRQFHSYVCFAMKNMSLPMFGDGQIRQILSNKLQHEDFRVDAFTVHPYREVTGIMGEHLRLTCIIHDNKLERNSTHSFFVKNKDISHGFGDFPAQVFKKEKNVFQLFQTINLHCINESIPSCYYIDDCHLVLPDLTSKGFTLLGHNYATDGEIRAVLKSLAGIHAGGIIFEEQQRVATGDPEYTLTKAFPEAFVEVHLQKNIPLLYRYFSAIITGITKAVDILEMPKTLSNGKCFADEVQKLWKIFELAPSKTLRNTLCHSDLWHANLFVKRHGNQGTAMQVKIIDFQIVRYMPPAADVLLVILLNTSRDYRRELLDSLLDEYFAHFTDFLRKEHINPDQIYTREMFKQSVQQMKFYAHLCNSFIVPLVTIDKHQLVEIYKSAELDQIIFEDRSILLRKFQDDKYYISRVKEVMLDLKDLFEEM